MSGRVLPLKNVVRLRHHAPVLCGKASLHRPVLETVSSGAPSWDVFTRKRQVAGDAAGLSGCFTA